MKVLLLLILIVLFPIVTLGQSPYAVHYNSNSGLSSNVIYQAHQDKTGRVWFCSDQGVTLYNGYSFTQYTTDDGLGDNEVFQIHEDGKGRIWFLTLNGKVSYYKDGKFYNNDDHPEFNRLTFNGHLTGVQSFENGSICISSDDIMYVLDENLALADSATFRGMIQSTWAIKNTIYFVSVGGIFQYDFKNESTRLDTVNWEKNYPRVFRSNGLTYIGSNHRIVELTDQNKTIIHEIDEITNEIISVNKINKDLWIGTRSGVVVYDPISKTVKNKLFTDDAVSSCISDFEGAIWVTTLNKGVHYIQNLEVKEVSGFSRTKVTCLEHYNDQLWAGLSKNRYATISKNGEHTIETISADVQDDISRIRVMKDASLWVIGKRVLMRSFDGKKTNWSHYLGLNDIYLSENQFWIGRRQGYLFPEEKFFHHLEITSSSVIHQEGFPRFKKLESRTNVFCEGREGTFWIGSEIGLYEVNNSGNPKLFSEKINGAVIDLIFSEKDQVLIVATRQNGIYIIKDHIVQKHFHNKNGLSGNLCRAVEIDTSGRIWVATHKGLDLVEIVTDGFRIKNQSNGIVSIDNINDLKIVEDRLYIATDSGIKYFSIEESINHAAKPILSFVQILVNNEKVDLNKKYHFSYHQNELEFEFIGVSFMLKNSLRYRYQLEGYDQEWYYSSERRINYKALPPGDYKFKVQVILPNDVPGELIVYDFSIEKPFWKSWWFIGLIVIVGGILLFVIWNHRLRKIKKKFQMQQTNIELQNNNLKIEKQLIELEQKALMLQMNPHFVFNALSTIKGYYASNDIQKAKNYISRFSQLLRLILENQDPFIGLDIEIQILEHYLFLSQVRYNHSFKYEITLQEELNNLEVMIPPMLVQPFVENAVLHGVVPLGENGQITVSFKKEDNMLQCTVKDNGVGRNRASSENQTGKKSIAISLTSERLKLLYSDEDVQDALMIIDEVDEIGNPVGTTVVMKIPFKSRW